MRALCTFFVLVVYCGVVAAQVQTIKKNCGDLGNATYLQVNKSYTFANSPSGFGQKQEYPKNIIRPSFIFKEENNTVWFLVPISGTGTFSFEITPKSPKDDFDWMVYQYSRNLRQEIGKETARPLRSNISRNDGSVAGKTGMKDGFKNFYAEPGPGRSFSKPVDVKSGDTLAIVVDNIYDNGSGFTLTTKLASTGGIPLSAVLKGKVIANDTKQPLSAQIFCEDDSTGRQLSQTTANAAGEYSIAVPLLRDINIVARHPGYIFKTEDVVLIQKSEQKDFSLDPVLSGNKAILFNIHFIPDKDVILASSEPDIARLVNFLTEYPQFDIRIVGHTNHNPFTDSGYLQRLSFFRAMAVKKRLIASGINEERLACMGKGGKEPITTSRIQKEAMRNLRVEIELKLRE